MNHEAWMTRPVVRRRTTQYRTQVVKLVERAVARVKRVIRRIVYRLIEVVEPVVRLVYVPEARAP